MKIVSLENLTPETVLSREQVADALTLAGFPISKSTLANLAVKAQGPLFRRFGKIAIYVWGEALAWAEHWQTSPNRGTKQHKEERKAIREKLNAKADAWLKEQGL